MLAVEMIRNVLTEIWRWSGQGRNRKKTNAAHQQQTLQKQIKLRTACQQSITSYCIHLSKHFRGKINKLKMRNQESCVFLLIRFVSFLFYFSSNEIQHSIKCVDEKEWLVWSPKNNKTCTTFFFLKMKKITIQRYVIALLWLFCSDSWTHTYT